MSLNRALKEMNPCGKACLWIVRPLLALQPAKHLLHLPLHAQHSAYKLSSIGLAHGADLCRQMLQGQNSRLLPVQSSSSLASIATSIYSSVPPGAQYTPTQSGGTASGGRVDLKSGPRGLDAFEASVLALNLPASSAGVNYQFTSGSYICVPALYSTSGASMAIGLPCVPSPCHAVRHLPLAVTGLRPAAEARLKYLSSRPL